jgi:uncharacterized membrane protein
MIISYAAVYVISLVTFGIGGILIAGPIMLATSFIYLNIATHNRAPKIEDLLIGAKGDNFLRSLIAYLRFTIFTFLWSLLFLIPGLIKSISYSQMFFLMVDHPKLNPSAAQKQSISMMDGHKMDYFILQLSFIPWYLLVIITLGLATIYVSPYVSTTNALFYKSLKPPKN